MNTGRDLVDIVPELRLLLPDTGGRRQAAEREPDRVKHERRVRLDPGDLEKHGERIKDAI